MFMAKYLGVGENSGSSSSRHNSPRSSLSKGASPRGATPAATEANTHTHADGRPKMVYKEGWMAKEGDVFKTWKRRFFILRGLTLTYLTDDPSSSSSAELKGIISLEGALLRDSLRKGVAETGFELVVNPSTTSREGKVLVQVDSGEATYASTTRALGGFLRRASSATLNTVTGSAPPPAERVYYLTMDPHFSHAGALEERRKWVEALANNLTYEARLAAWAEAQKEEQARAVKEAQDKLEILRAEIEVEKRNWESEEAERKRQQQQHTWQEIFDSTHPSDSSPLPPSLTSPLSSDVPSAIPSSPGRSGMIRSSSTGSFTSREALVAAQRAADDALISASGENAPMLVAALKRKNQLLEKEMRRLVKEMEEREATAAKRHAKHAASPRHLAPPNAASAVPTPTASQEQLPVVSPLSDVAPSRPPTLLLDNLSPVSDATDAPSLVSVFPPSPTPSAPGTPTQRSQTSPHHLSAETLSLDSADNKAARHTRRRSSNPFLPDEAAQVAAAVAAADKQEGQQEVAASVSLSSSACACTCTPPCVPHSTHSDLQSALSAVESRYAALLVDKQAADANVQRYKAERKILKAEVLRLRGALQEISSRVRGMA